MKVINSGDNIKRTLKEVYKILREGVKGYVGQSFPDPELPRKSKDESN